ncbi:hypothetical protein CI102_2462 [Trichoderma harzianum]|nr:hypothetical protein CI102_2462 [Trichoderma harzianum]
MPLPLLYLVVPTCRLGAGIARATPKSASDSCELTSLRMHIRSCIVLITARLRNTRYEVLFRELKIQKQKIVKQNDAADDKGHELIWSLGSVIRCSCVHLHELSRPAF